MPALLLKPLHILLLVPPLLAAQFITSTFPTGSAAQVNSVTPPKTAADLSDHCPHTTLQTAKAISINEDADIILDDGRRLKIANIFFPRTGANSPLPEETIRFLRRNLAQKTIKYIAAAKTDRYQRTPAHIITQSDNNPQTKWFQPKIIQAGLGLFMPEPFKEKHNPYCDNDDLKQILRHYDQENMRKQNHSPLIPVYKPDNDILWEMEGNFIFVEGALLKTHSSDKKIFLNFGTQWKSDFTAVISSNAEGAIQKHFKSISNLEGKQLRLRGFLDLYNGPSMRIDHPLQMELLSE